MAKGPCGDEDARVEETQLAVSELVQTILVTFAMTKFFTFQNTVEGLSFGQSAGLKDDLDVDDNDVGEKKKQAFLDLLMEAGQNGSVLTPDEVREQVDTIMFEVDVADRKHTNSPAPKRIAQSLIAH